MVGVGKVVDLVVRAVKGGTDEVVETSVGAVEDAFGGLFAGGESA